MGLESRIERLEKRAGVRQPCPVCDGAPSDADEPKYDETRFSVSDDYLEMNHACVHCGRPRQIILRLIERIESA